MLIPVKRVIECMIENVIHIVSSSYALGRPQLRAALGGGGG